MVQVVWYAGEERLERLAQQLDVAVRHGGGQLLAEVADLASCLSGVGVEQPGVEGGADLLVGEVEPIPGRVESPLA